MSTQCIYVSKIIFTKTAIISLSTINRVVFVRRRNVFPVRYELTIYMPVLFRIDSAHTGLNESLWDCLYTTLSLLVNGLVNTFPRQWRIFGGVVFYAVHVVSKKWAISSSQNFLLFTLQISVYTSNLKFYYILEFCNCSTRKDTWREPDPYAFIHALCSEKARVLMWMTAGWQALLNWKQMNDKDLEQNICVESYKEH
jgi:hypothetical protein